MSNTPNPMENISKEYQASFDSRGYLDQYFTTCDGGNEVDVSFVILSIEVIHNLVKSNIIKDNTRLIEIGCGPTIHNLIPIASKCKEMVLCDHLDRNLDEIRKWLNQTNDSFNWDHLIEYYCQLDGNNRTLEEVSEWIRSIPKELITIDLLQDDILQGKRFPPFDVLVCSLCLEACCSTEDVYRNAVKNCVDLLSSGGVIMMVAVLNQSYYDVAGKRYATLPLTEDLIRSTMHNVGCEVTQWKFNPFKEDLHDEKGNPVDYCNCSGFALFVAAKK